MHVLNCVDGCIPSDMATGKAEDIEEERRLLYVAMTRAKDHLTLSVATSLLRARSRAAPAIATCMRREAASSTTMSVGTSTRMPGP